MRMLCWKCAKEYARQKDGEWNIIQGQFVCNAKQEDGTTCQGMLISKKVYDEQMRAISEAGIKGYNAGKKMREIVLPTKKAD